MPISGHLKVEFPDGRESIRLAFDVSDQDLTILRGFAASAGECLEAVSRAGGLSARLQVKWAEGEGVQYSTEEPSPDQRAAILHHLRPLLLTKEPWSFDRTCAAVGRSSDHPFLGERLRRIRHIYSGADLRDEVIISRGDLTLNSEAAFAHWLNGFEYHRDTERAAAIASDDDPLPFDATRTIFLMMLADKLRAIGLLFQVVDQMLAPPPNPRLQQPSP